MAKTERILSYLPRTFLAGPEPSALRSVVGAFGGELLASENSLAGVMKSHWVDLADLGDPGVLDLGLMAVLYGLAPRDDESVEEFRDHLKRYVRTFLEGTVTVQGILRVAAEALGLHIADAYSDLDAWWTRDDDRRTVVSADPADAAPLILGLTEGDIRGDDPRAAILAGTVDLTAGVDLRATPAMTLRLGGGASVTVDLTASAGDPAQVRPAEIVAALVAALGPATASDDGHFVTLSAPGNGPGSALRLEPGFGDASEPVLGVRPRRYRGTPATAAVIDAPVGPGGVDVSLRRYLRLAIDNATPVEVDLFPLATDPQHATPAELVTAINAAVGTTVASAVAGGLRLASPTTGVTSRIRVLAAPAQDAAPVLLPGVAPYTLGTDATGAAIRGTVDLSGGADVDDARMLHLALDGGPTLSVNVAGAEPAATTLAEIVTRVNAALGAPVAGHDGRLLTLRSPTTGPTSSLLVEEADDDAATRVLGLLPLGRRGTAAVTATITGAVDLDDGVSPERAVDVAAVHRFAVAVDGGTLTIVDLRAGTDHPRALSLDDLVRAVNAQTGSTVATAAGTRLQLRSPTPGVQGRIGVSSLRRSYTERFVTVADVTDDAAPALLGRARARARGSDGAPAVVVGVREPAGSFDLREKRYLRIGLDGAPPVDVDCAGPRARGTTPPEAAAAINAALGVGVASATAERITLLSPTVAATSTIAFHAPQFTDALDAVLGAAPATTRGTAATGVSFAGLADLSIGVDLAADAVLSVGIDGAPPVEIAVGDAAATRRTLSQLVVAVNLALAAQVASHDGRHLLLTSPSHGAASRLELGVPTGTDASEAVLGVTGPRTYAGESAEPATVIGDVLHTGTIDLSQRRFLRISIDGALPADVDLAATVVAADRDPATATLADVVLAMNAALGVVARDDGGRLRITSRSAGLSSRVTLDHVIAGDARPVLFPDAPDVTVGEGPSPATVTGEVDLLAPTDLEGCERLQVTIDGGLPLVIDVAGPVAASSALEEVVHALNAARPGLADVVEGNRLRLRSPTDGFRSSLDVSPVRQLALAEYPARTTEVAVDSHHAGPLVLRNPGAAPEPLQVVFRSMSGGVGPKLASLDDRWWVRAMVVARPGDEVTVSRTANGAITGRHRTSDGTSRAIGPEQLQVLHFLPGRGLPCEVPRGRSRHLFLECDGERLGTARFDTARFAGPQCPERAVFDTSRFTVEGAEQVVFASRDVAQPVPLTTVALRHGVHEGGRFRVRLPADLDRRFGGRFGSARFGRRSPEQVTGLVIEPLGDPRHMATALSPESGLVEAVLVDRVPIGFSPVTLPFRAPVRLKWSRRDDRAHLYVTGDGLEDRFVRISAKIAGRNGEDIAVTATRSGPALFDLSIAFPGDRFEWARAAAGGDPLPVLGAGLVQAQRVGVLLGKAAGVHADVVRDRASDRNTQPPSEDPE